MTRNKKPKALAVALWMYAKDEVGVPLDRALPVGPWRKAIAHFMDVGSSESERRYLELLDRLDLIDRRRGYVILRDPEGPIPYVRPPEELETEPEAGETVTA